MEKNKVLQPTSDAFDLFFPNAMEEILRIGVHASQVGEKGIRGIRLFWKGESIVFGLKCGHRNLWIIDADKAMGLFSEMESSYGVDCFWETIKYGYSKSILSQYFKIEEPLLIKAAS